MFKKKTQNNPFFSIVLPTFNSAKTLKKALDSLASQTFASFEVNILDNLSTDGTKDIAAEYVGKDPRFKWLSEKDNGIYFAMNKGIGLATGNWIFFLGSDDYLYSPDVLATVHRNILQKEGVEMVYGNVRLSKPLPPDTEAHIYGGEYTPEKLLWRNICHQCMFFHRRLFKRFGLYRTKYVVFSDWDFNLRIFNKVSAHYIDKVIAFYNVDGLSGTSHNRDVSFGKEFFENMATRYSYSFKDGYFDNKKKKLLDTLLKQVGKRKFVAAANVGRILAYQALPRRLRL